MLFFVLSCSVLITEQKNGVKGFNDNQWPGAVQKQ